MTITEYALGELKSFVSGDNGLTPYLSGPKLVELFNSFGERNEYRAGFPSRNKYVLEHIVKLNGTKNLRDIFEIIFSERHFRTDKTKNLKSAIEEINLIINPEGYELNSIEGIYRIKLIGSLDLKTSEIHFEEIQSQIKEALIKAKYIIWIAVAWFTDKELYSILVQKSKSGVHIQLLIIDDEINRNSGINFGKDFWVFKIPKKGKFENLMHHKFCIIDLKTVIHGTYNWTNKARYNNETIDIEKGRENAEKFADEFVKLKTL